MVTFDRFTRGLLLGVGVLSCRKPRDEIAKQTYNPLPFLLGNLPLSFEHRILHSQATCSL